MKRYDWVIVVTGLAALAWFVTAGDHRSAAQQFENVQIEEKVQNPGEGSAEWKMWRQRSPEMEPQELETLIERYRATDESNVRERRRLMTSLLALLHRQFDAHQEIRDRQIEELQQRLDKLRELQGRRQDAREQIVRSRLDQLLRDAEGLGWGTLQPQTELAQQFFREGADEPLDHMPGGQVVVREEFRTEGDGVDEEVRIVENGADDGEQGAPTDEQNVEIDEQGVEEGDEAADSQDEVDEDADSDDEADEDGDPEADEDSDDEADEDSNDEADEDSDDEADEDSDDAADGDSDDAADGDSDDAADADSDDDQEQSGDSSQGR